VSEPSLGNLIERLQPRARARFREAFEAIVTQMAADDEPRDETEGRIEGRKLSATDSNSKLENRGEMGVQGSAEPPSPGWGPGGRRFKSCLPD
jgi:hypothetical protein